MKKTLPIGVQDYAVFVKKNCYYVDKTPFIKPLLTSGTAVQLITRPRRFGKTLFMDTLKSFLQIDKNHPGDASCQQTLFSETAVIEDKAFCTKYMGQFPVLFITLKGVEGDSFEMAYGALAQKIVDLAEQYDYLGNSSRLSDAEKQYLNHFSSLDFMMNPENRLIAQSFLRVMVTCLSKHFGQQVVLLIDEYDVPLAKAAEKGYYRRMVDFVRAFFGQVLKPDTLSGNAGALPYLEKAVLTGCLRVGKESIFSDFNNPAVNTVCSIEPDFNELFGFTSAEVKALLDYCGLTSYEEIVKRWYDGYRIGSSEVYCPWDVINFCSKALKATEDKQVPYAPENFWKNSSANQVITDFLAFLSGKETERMQTLVDGGAIDITVNEKLNYNDLEAHDPENFWTLLLSSGYLTIAERSSVVSTTLKVRIPNEEIRETFREKILGFFSKSNRRYRQHAVEMVETALKADAAGVKRVLMQLLINYVSVRDTATKASAENYYHAFLLGLLTGAEGIITNLASNVESGDGYADMIFTDAFEETGVVIEVKRCGEKTEMADAAERAMKQIGDKRYDTYLRRIGCSKVVGLGIAFSGKSCAVTAAELTTSKH